MLIGFGISLFSKEFFQIFASDEYQTVYLYVPLSVISLVISSATVVYSTLLCAQDRTKQNSLATMVGGVTSVVLNLLLIPLLGLFGSCFASILAFFIILVITYKATGCVVSKGTKQISLVFLLCCIIVFLSVYIHPFGNPVVIAVFKIFSFIALSVPLGIRAVKLYKAQL